MPNTNTWINNELITVNIELRELVKEAAEIMEIVYAGNFPAGIESFLTRAHRQLAASPSPVPPETVNG